MSAPASSQHVSQIGSNGIAIVNAMSKAIGDAVQKDLPAMLPPIDKIFETEEGRRAGAKLLESVPFLWTAMNHLPVPLHGSSQVVNTVAHRVFVTLTKMIEKHVILDNSKPICISSASGKGPLAGKLEFYIDQPGLPTTIVRPQYHDGELKITGPQCEEAADIIHEQLSHMGFARYNKTLDSTIDKEGIAALLSKLGPQSDDSPEVADLLRKAMMQARGALGVDGPQAQANSIKNQAQNRAEAMAEAAALKKKLGEQ